MGALRRTVVGAAAIAASAPAVADGQTSDTVGVVLSALEHARGSLPAGRVVVDPRLVCTARLVGWSCPSGVEVGASEMVYELGSRDFSHLCLASSGGCRLVGTDVLVEPSQPRISRRTASIVLDVWWDADDSDRIVSQRRTLIRLQRDRDGAWQVVGEEIRVPEGGGGGSPEGGGTPIERG